MSASWRVLSPAPFKHFSKPIKLSDREFIIFPKTEDYQKPAGDGIYKYSHDKWTKIVRYSNDTKVGSIAATFDINAKKKVIYIRNPSKNSFEEIPIHKTNEIQLNLDNYNGEIILDDKNQKIHIIQPDNHSIFDINTKMTRMPFTFTPERNYKFIQIPSKGTILAIEGDGETNAFWEYDETWKILDDPIPSKMKYFGFVRTLDEKYVILLGGGCSENIFVYSVIWKIFRKCKIKCPLMDKCDAVIMNDIEYNNLRAFGFVNHCFKEMSFDGMRLMPFYLIKIVEMYLESEFIYILGSYGGNNKHFKINVKCIMNNLSD